MTNIASLEVELDLDSGQFSATLTKAGSQVQKFGRTVDEQGKAISSMKREMDGLAASLENMQKLAKGFVGFKALTAAFGDLVNTQKAMQQIQYGLQGALGSAKAAGDAYSYISAKSQELGLDLQTTATEFTKVTAAATAMGVPMKQQQSLFDALARSQTVMHLSTDQVKYSTMALAQMFGKGKIQAEELRRQLGEQIPGVVPRFQNAVMQMVKGTDLQGKSFDQLLQMGALTTDKFLPALIQALQETGKGADEAAQGLNANLNRLSSEWFKLKASFTGGLFNDTLTASVAMLAANLQSLATAATVAIGVAGARYASKGIQKGSSKASSAIAEAQAAHEAALADVERQKAAIAASEATIADTQALIARNEKLLVSADLAMVNSANLTEEAQNEIRAAKATLAHQESTLGLTANYRAREKAAADLALAEAKLIAADAQATTAGVRKTRVNEILLREHQAITAAELEQAAATRALAAAQVEVEATNFTGRLATGIKGLGSSLMSLIGGPWGAALIAVGALGTAIYEVNQESEAYREETKKEGQALIDLKKHIDDAAASYSDLKTRKSLAEASDDFAKSSQEINKYKAELADLISKRDEMVAAMSQQGDGGLYAGFDLDKVSSRIAELQDKIGPAEEALNSFRGRLSYGLTPAVDALKESFDRLKSGGGMKDILKGLFVGFDRGVKTMDDAKAKVDSLLAEMQSATAANEKRAETAGKTAVQLAELRYNKTIAQLKEETDLTKEQYDEKLKGIQKVHAADVAAAKDADAVKTDKKGATKAAREAAQIAKDRESQLTSITDRIRQLNSQELESLNLNAKLNPAQRLENAILTQLASTKSRLTEADKKAIRIALDEMLVNGKKLAQQEELRKAKEAMLRLNEQLAIEDQATLDQNSADLMAVGHGSAALDQAKRKIAIEKWYAGEVSKLRSQKLAEDSQSYKEQNARIQQDYAWRLEQEDQYQIELKNKQADWKNGFFAAFEDFQASAANTAESVKQITASAFSQMTNVLTEFVTTGKASFKDLMTYVLKEITRVLVAKAVAKLASLVIGLFGGGTGEAFSGGGGSYSANSGGMGAYSFANGGIMTSEGSLPLKKYANGGIASSPQLALFGEGKTPEAFVPLPDGRSIPVTMQGAGGGGVQSTVSVNVTVNNDGSSSSNAKASNQQAKELGSMITEKVRDTMAKEMRQGGLLWKMRNGG